MPVVKCKPTSAGRRGVVKVVSLDLHKGPGYAPLLEKKKKSGGRNNKGRITVRHHGGGHKQHYRKIVFPWIWLLVWCWRRVYSSPSAVLFYL